MDSCCEGILPQSKCLRNSQKLRKIVVIYKKDKLILSKKSLSLKTRGLEKRTLHRKVAAPNLVSLFKPLHIICFWYHFEQ